MLSQTSQCHLYDTVAALAGARVGVVGDLVADLYISGLTDRVSREAPVLIVRYEKEWLRPGGAANVAANIAALGATAVVVGTVGDDEMGQRLLEQLTHSSIGGGSDGSGRGRVCCEHVVRAAGRSTISKTRFLAGAKSTHRQQVLRLDRQPSESLDAALIARIREQVATADSQVDAWVASDYGYGSFDDGLRDLLREIARRKPVLADSRWALPTFAGMTLLKPNEEEARQMASELGLDATNAGVFAAGLANRLEAQAVLITLGNKGMVLAVREAVVEAAEREACARIVRIPAVGTEEIVDLTGAGDSVAATLATALAAGCNFEVAARLANHSGGIVVMKEGAATASPDELRESIKTWNAGAR